MRMTKGEISYESLSAICDSISSAQDLADVGYHVVRQLTGALGLKGCSLMLLDHRTKELQIGAAYGLSDRYLHKGPISALKSIAQSLEEGPVAIYNVSDDPRLQYPKEAEQEGIKSILSVPMVLRGRPLGVLRLYTAEPWEFTMQDLTFVTAIALMVGLVLDNLRATNAYKTSLDVLKHMRKDWQESQTVN
jgi:signal transduction protein with GAF and PtsI domain